MPDQMVVQRFSYRHEGPMVRGAVFLDGARHRGPGLPRPDALRLGGPRAGAGARSMPRRRGRGRGTRRRSCLASPSGPAYPALRCRRMRGHMASRLDPPSIPLARAARPLASSRRSAPGLGRAYGGGESRGPTPA